MPLDGPPPGALLDAKSAVETMLLAHTKTLAALGQQGFAASFSQEPRNIIGVGIGRPTTVGGTVDPYGGPPGEHALTLYVIEQRTPAELHAQIEAIVGKQDDLPIHVVVTGIVEAQSHQMRMSPAPGGISIGHFRVTAGTLGCLATGRTAPRNAQTFILSNSHILADLNTGAAGDCIAQPARGDGGSCPGARIGTLETFTAIDFAGDNLVDSATALVADTGAVRPEIMYMQGSAPRYLQLGAATVAPTIGLTVAKSGRSSQVTVGRVINDSATIRVHYGPRSALFRDQIAIQGLDGDFSKDGDSGSLVWTHDPAHNPVGLLFAGGASVSFANKLDAVLAALDIRLVT